MCRLYGYCGRAEQNLSHVILDEENCLKKQSAAHRDGWGICFYEENQPQVIKSYRMAKCDRIFSRIASVLSSKVFIAHLRRATQGRVGFLNCHPFCWQQWSFAHNGDFPHFQEIVGDIRAMVRPEFLSQVRGSTDSELYFALFLTEWHKTASSLTPEIKNIAQALRMTVSKVQSVYDHHGISKKPALNTIITNGSMMVALKFGHELSYKVIGESSEVLALEISSEPLSKDPGWRAFLEGQMIGVDEGFSVFLDL